MACIPGGGVGSRNLEQLPDSVIPLAFVLRMLDRLRSLPLWMRLLCALLFGLLAFLVRITLLDHRPGAGRDLMLVAIVLSAFWWGFWPGLVTGFTVRGLALWYFVGPPEVTLVRPWDDKGIWFFIVMTVSAAWAAGTALLVLSRAEDRGDDGRPPDRLEG